MPMLQSALIVNPVRGESVRVDRMVTVMERSRTATIPTEDLDPNDEILNGQNLILAGLTMMDARLLLCLRGSKNEEMTEEGVLAITFQDVDFQDVQ